MLSRRSAIILTLTSLAAIDQQLEQAQSSSIR